MQHAGYRMEGLACTHSCFGVEAVANDAAAA